MLTGKGVGWGGSNFRTEETGYGLLYFTQTVLHMVDETLKGKTIPISGSGNVALHAVEKAIEMGGKVLTVSSSSGYIYDEDGINNEKLDYLKDLKFNRKGRVKEYVKQYPDAAYHEGKGPGVKRQMLPYPVPLRMKSRKKMLKSWPKMGCDWSQKKPICRLRLKQ